MLQNHLLFSGVPNDKINEILSAIVAKKVAKGELIFMQEDSIKYLYYIKSGWVKIFTETVEGEEAIIDVLPTDNFFGDHALLEDDIVRYNAEAVDACEVQMIPIQIVRSLFFTSPEFAKNIVKYMSLKQKFRDKEIEHLSLQNAPQRIGCFLLRLCKTNQDSNVLLDLPYDKSLIASRLGMKSETFSRALNKLKREVGIDVRGNKILLSSVSSLSHYCCSSCSDSYPCDDKKAM